jgi:hypothetical protein
MPDGSGSGEELTRRLALTGKRWNDLVPKYRAPTERGKLTST